MNPVIWKIRQINSRFLCQSCAFSAYHLAVAVTHHLNSAYAPSQADSCQRPSTTFLALFDELIACRTEEMPGPLEALARRSAHVYWLRGKDSCKRQNVFRGFCKAGQRSLNLYGCCGNWHVWWWARKTTLTLGFVGRARREIGRRVNIRGCYWSCQSDIAR